MAAPKALHSVHRALAARPLLAALVVLGLLAAFAAAATRLKLDGDMAALLPSGPRSPQEAARLLSDFGVLDTFLVEVSSEALAPEALAAQTEQVRGALESSEQFLSVRSAPPTAELFALAARLVPHRLQLLDDPAGELERRLAPEVIDAQLAALRAQLTTPEAIGLKQTLLDDPLGLDRELLRRVAGASGDFEIVGPALMAKDLKAALIIARPKQSALSVDASRRVLAEVERVRASLPTGVKLRAVGGPRFVAESAGAVKHDVIFNLVSSGLALLMIFLARFRGLRLFLLGSIPLGLGVLGALAVVALTKGRIHGLSLGFGAALIGIAVDYPLHLLNLAWHEEGPAAERLARATDAVWSSLWLGFLTTASGFLLVGASEFPALQELALFAGVGLTIAFLITLVLVPPLCVRLGPLGSQPIRWAGRVPRLAFKRSTAVLSSVVLLAIAAALGSRVGFDGNLRNLDAQSTATLDEHASVLGRFGISEAGALAVSSGATSEAALAQNDAAWAALQRTPGVTRVRTIATMLPSAQTQTARIESLRRLELGPLKLRLSEAAARAGFSATAFDGFWAGVATTREGQVPPLTLEDLRGTMLGELVERSVRCGPLGCKVIAVIEKSPGAAIAAPAGDVWVVDGAELAAQTVERIPRQLFLLCGLGLLANLVLLGVAWRSPRLGLLACFPCALGLVGAVGIFSAIGRPLDLVSASGLVLVLGCGVDYGIFVLQGLEGGQQGGVEAVGVLLASLTTLAGFGTLAFATYPALASLGLAVGLGVLLSAFAALVLLPGLHSLGRAR